MMKSTVWTFVSTASEQPTLGSGKLDQHWTWKREDIGKAELL